MTISPETLERRIDGIHNLPTLPDMYEKVQDVIRRPNSNARDVGAVVAEDPALTGRLLRMVNSAFYSLVREITTIDQAVVVLGMRELEHAVLATSILKVFAGRDTNPLFNVQEFWKHALGTAVASREISRRLGAGKPHEMFTMGLLHDIGKLVLDLFFTNDFGQVLEEVQKGRRPIVEVEREVLGVTHADVGGILARKWSLPDALVEVIQYHHAPLESETCQQEAAVVNLADMLCRAKSWGFPGDPFVPELAEGTQALLGLEASHVAPLMQILDEHYQDAVTLLGPA